MYAIVLAGGYATRLRPTSLSFTKHLVPLANRPVLGWVLSQIAEVGVREVFIVVGSHNREQIVEYVGDGSRFGVSVEYLVQERPLGLAHAVSLAEGFVDGPFLVYLGDNLLQGGVAQYAKRFLDAKADAMVLLKEVEDPTRFGVAVFDGGRLSGFVEKPRQPPSRYALVGVYFFTPAIFDYIKRLKPSWRGEYEITDVLDLMLKDGRRVEYAVHDGWWLDVGKKDDVLAANALLLDEYARREVRGRVEDSKIEGRVVVEEGAVVRNSVVRGPAVVGRGAVIEGSFIGPYTSVGDGAVVRNSAVEYSVLMEGAVVEGVERLEESLVGRYARVASNARRYVRLHISDYSVVEL
ncbi:glucose-1-phosphate thymidylyltransferase [Pyrobaculum ferrireducens]|uniref:Glucose-1-phosphate thymidylyltransferase (GraD-2) n=1 Tax=Pyrobaculum ferrireducens TaxID=1104324 RepID=G7VI01_9CREN|nr:glucose-1-phosphate thymidylyltransferase [Pyrobaculum ferrireducens]AET33361.1 glucose-1-phosphate thymidylyltransferase (graD-2) [Pyrobaculum ferrireducens]